MSFAQVSVNTPFSLGKDSQGEDVTFQLSQLPNPHVVFCGKSGSGKTFNIVNLIDNLVMQGLTFHVLGFHADFAYEDFAKRNATRCVTPETINHMKFQYSNSDISLNPFSFDPHPDHGGIVNAVKSVVNVVQLSYKKLGEKQQGYLEKTLMEIYEQKGFVQEDQSTWGKQTMISENDGKRVSSLPTLEDLLVELDLIYSNLTTELNESLYTNIRKLRHKVEKSKSRMNDPDVSAAAADKARDAYKIEIEHLDGLFKKLVEQDSLGLRGTAYYSEWDKNTVNSLRDIINRMILSTLYTGRAAQPLKGHINFYDISKLQPKDQETITYILLNKIYNKAVIDTGDDLNPDFPSSYVVADEGRYIGAAAKNPMSPVNLMMGGARKFGLGLMVGIQGAHQMSKDMSDNFALKFVVDSDISSDSEMRKSFGLSSNMMRKLVPKKNAWISIGSKMTLTDTWK